MFKMNGGAGWSHQMLFSLLYLRFRMVCIKMPAWSVGGKKLPIELDWANPLRQSSDVWSFG